MPSRQPPPSHLRSTLAHMCVPRILHRLTSLYRAKCNAPPPTRPPTFAFVNQVKNLRMYPHCVTMTFFIQLEARISVPGFHSDRKVNYGIVTLTFSTPVWNCESNFRFSVRSSIWKGVPKTNNELLFENLFQNKL